MRTFICLLAICLTLKLKANDQPNIVLILADDLSWFDIGCYGSKDANTPNIDRLASEGMLFSNAFTATAMCAPTRQQLYTGMFPVRNGSMSNHSEVEAGTKSLVQHLGELGYAVFLRGKTHFGPKPAQLGRPKGWLHNVAPNRPQVDQTSTSKKDQH